MSYSPKYILLSEQLKRQIRNGVYKFGNKLPTESEIAQQYSLSRQTVRQALSILAEQNYIRRVHGSGSYVTYESSSERKTKQIAVIATIIGEYIFPAILQEVEEIATRYGYAVIIRATGNSIATERQILESLMDSEIDGIIVEGTKTALPNPNISYYQKMADAGIKIVFFNGYYPALKHENIKHVVVDDYGGGKNAVKLLTSKGHRAIGGIFKFDDMQGIQRFSGFIDGILQYGAEMDDRRFLWFETKVSPFDMNDATVTQELLNTCTGLVCYADPVAIALLPRITEEHPNITAIVSFDRNLPVTATGIDFYSFGHPKQELGRLAINKLIQMMHGENVDSQVLPWK